MNEPPHDHPIRIARFAGRVSVHHAGTLVAAPAG